MQQCQVWINYKDRWYPGILETWNRRNGALRYWITYAVPVNGWPGGWYEAALSDESDDPTAKTKAGQSGLWLHVPTRNCLQRSTSGRHLRARSVSPAWGNIIQPDEEARAASYRRVSSVRGPPRNGTSVPLWAVPGHGKQTVAGLAIQSDCRKSINPGK